MWLNPQPKIAKAWPTNAAYTAKEDRLILEFASKNLAEVGGKKVWKLLQDSGAIEPYQIGRTNVLEPDIIVIWKRIKIISCNDSGSVGQIWGGAIK